MLNGYTRMLQTWQELFPGKLHQSHDVVQWVKVVLNTRKGLESGYSTRNMFSHGMYQSLLYESALVYQASFACILFASPGLMLGEVFIC